MELFNYCNCVLIESDNTKFMVAKTNVENTVGKLHIPKEILSSNTIVYVKHKTEYITLCTCDNMLTLGVFNGEEIVTSINDHYLSTQAAFIQLQILCNRLLNNIQTKQVISNDSALCKAWNNYLGIRHKRINCIKSYALNTGQSIDLLENGVSKSICIQMCAHTDYEHAYVNMCCNGNLKWIIEDVLKYTFCKY